MWQAVTNLSGHRLWQAAAAAMDHPKQGRQARQSRLQSSRGQRKTSVGLSMCRRHYRYNLGAARARLSSCTCVRVCSPSSFSFPFLLPVKMCCPKLPPRPSADSTAEGRERENERRSQSEVVLLQREDPSASGHQQHQQQRWDSLQTLQHRESRSSSARRSKSAGTGRDGTGAT